jgi:hypothetical protein
MEQALYLNLGQSLKATTPTGQAHLCSNEELGAAAALQAALLAFHQMNNHDVTDESTSPALHRKF